MSKKLLDIIFASEKRKTVLLLLNDGAKEMNALLNVLGTSRSSLLPQIRFLEDHYLVNHYNDTYELTIIGQLIVKEMLPLLENIDVLDQDIDYWGTHDLDFVPLYLLKSIDKLRKCKVITPSFKDVYKLNEEILETSPISKDHYGIVTFYHPLFLQFLSKLISNNVNVNMIVSRSVMDGFRNEHCTEFEKLMQNERFHFSLYTGKMSFVGFACNDHYFMLRLLKSNGEFDTKYILCNDKEALEWGKELFAHCLKNSTTLK